MIAELVFPLAAFVLEHDVKTKCGACGKPLGSGETIHVAGGGPRCSPCFHRETADGVGIDFDEPKFQPIVLEDAEGAPHTFKFHDARANGSWDRGPRDHGRRPAWYRFAARQFRSGRLETVPGAVCEDAP
jgi:hypothetical protein